MQLIVFYNITGKKAGETGISDTKSLKHLFGNFYKDSSGKGYFFSGSFALANLRVGNTDSYGVAILNPNSATQSDVAGNYNFVILENSDRPNICQAHFDVNNTGFVNNCLGDNVEVNFNWKVSNGIVEVADNWEQKNIYLKGFFKKATNGRDLIVFDLINTPNPNGGAVIVALKANEITADEIGVSTFYSFDASNPNVTVNYEKPFGKADVNGTRFSYIEADTFGNFDPNETGEGKFILNPTVNGVKYNGLVRIEEKNNTGGYDITDEYAIIDSVNGYYISLAMNETDEDGEPNEFYYSIGSNKPLQ